MIADPFAVRELETLARREGRTRNALLHAYGDLWGALTANGRQSLGVQTSPSRTLTIDLEHPSLAGVRERDVHLAIATCASSRALLSGPRS